MRNIAIVRARTFKVAAIMLFFFGISIGIVHSNSAGPIPSVSGVPAGGGFEAEVTCDTSGCHESFKLNPDDLGSVELTGVPDNYIPGQTYSLRFRITHSDMNLRRWGFQMAAVDAVTFQQAGTFIVTDSQRTQTERGGRARRTYIQHTVLGTFTGRRGGTSWTFDWRAPSTNTGDVAFYGSGNAANNDNAVSGDKIYNPTPNPLAVAKGQFEFTDVATEANLVAEAGGGVAIGDFNNDQSADIFVAAGNQYMLYRNTGDGTFEEVAESAGIMAGEALGQAAAWGDVDGDDYLDLYVVNAGADVLYRNNGDGTFSDVSAEAGISDEVVGHAAAWGDYNGDEQLDLYVANEGQDLLYLNNGDGTFTQADPMVLGIVEEAAGWSVALSDYNGDDRLDIFVANDGQDFLYRNNGDGTFTDVAAMAGIQTDTAEGRAAAWADYDGDGDPDLFIANIGADRLYRNNGDGTFTDVAAGAGLGDTLVGLAATWGDYDNDSDPDLFVANEGQDFLYRNNGDGTFNQVAELSGMTDMAMGQGAVWVDIENDGNLDLFVSNAAGNNFLYQNPGRSGMPETKVAGQTPGPKGYLHSAITWVLNTWFS